MSSHRYELMESKIPRATAIHVYLPYMMWVLASLFFAYQFILRLWPGLLMNQIMTQLSIDAKQFGIIASFYYYGYAGMQIPVALLLERFGAKNIIFMFACFCGLASLLFTYTSNWYVACLARFLVGAGSAVGLLGTSKVISEWFPEFQYTRMIGFTFTLGLMGAVFGEKPVSLLIEAYPWKQVALVLSLIALGIGIAVLFLLRLNTNRANLMIKAEPITWLHLKSILASRELLLLALANLLLVGGLEGFSDVWGISFLIKAYGIHQTEAAELISFIFFGMICGGPLLALLSKKYGDYAMIALCGFGLMVGFLALLGGAVAAWLSLACLLFGLGILCCYQVSVFSAGATLVKPQYLGVTIAFLNCINMLGGSFFHTVIGRVVQLCWTGELNQDGVKQYSLAAYQFALALIPICAGLGAVLVCILGMYIRQKDKMIYSQI